MGYTTSTVHGIQVPDSSQANNIPEDIGKVVAALEGGSILRRLTQTQIDALTAPQKPAGLAVINTTTGRMQMSNGSTFVDVGSPTYAVGERTTAQSVGAGALATMTYTGETDPSSMLNPATGIVTLPSAGLWVATALIVRASSQQGCLVNLTYGGAVVAGQDLSVAATVTTVFVGAAGADVHAEFFNAAASSTTITGRLAVAKIGP